MEHSPGLRPQSIYSAKIVQIQCLVKGRGRKSRNKKSRSDQAKVSAQPSPRVPAEDEGDKLKLLDELIDSELGSATWKFFQNMKKRNVRTEINELCQLEQREQFTRPVSYLYRA
ncbi:hypothetical protein Mapa_013955 [Marchantia paleacea]|nr:hypothetical protein Mapa_013955 [Marchantia paleacea]